MELQTDRHQKVLKILQKYPPQREKMEEYAEKIAQELGIKGRDKQLLIKGSLAPDLFGDFPHHGAKTWEELWRQTREIWRSIKEAMFAYAHNDDMCYYELGKAFHYIQDRWTATPGTPQEHSKWEQQIDDCEIVDDLSLEEYIKNAILPSKTIKGYLDLLNDVAKGVEGVNPQEYGYQSWYDYQYWNDYFLSPYEYEKLANLFYYARRSHPMVEHTKKGWTACSFSTPLLDLNFAYRICLGVARYVFSPKAKQIVEELEEKELEKKKELEEAEYTEKKVEKPSPHKKIVGTRRFRILPAVLGFVWLFMGLGVFAMDIRKFMQWNYIVAWMLLFGIPCIILFKLSFPRIKTLEKMTAEESLKETSLAKEDTVAETAHVYKEAFPELSEEEAELQETQEVDMDFEDEEEDL